MNTATFRKTLIIVNSKDKCLHQPNKKKKDYQLEPSYFIIIIIIIIIIVIIISLLLFTQDVLHV